MEISVQIILLLTMLFRFLSRPTPTIYDVLKLLCPNIYDLFNSGNVDKGSMNILTITNVFVSTPNRCE